MRLDDRTVRGLPLESDRGKADIFYFDDTLAGFAVRCRKSGKRVWILQYRTMTGQRRVTLGAVEKIDAITAHKAAKKYLAEVTLGGDPQEVKRKARLQRTFGSVVVDYLDVKRAKVRPRTFVEAKRYLTDAAYWKCLHGQPIGLIRRDDVMTRLRTIAKNTGPVAVARAQVNLSSLFSWALGEGLCELNPVIGTNTPAEPPSRDRVLKDHELAAIWRACEDDDYGRCIKLLALTGQRRGEVGGMCWSELDLDAGLWRLPATRVKNARAHIVPLSELAWSIIKAVPRRNDDDNLFGLHNVGFQNWGKAKDRLDARIKPPLDAWRAHDLRRTAATGMANLGVLPHVIEAALNHQTGAKRGVAGVYNKSPYEREVRTALALWADHVRAIVEGTERKVVPLKSVG
jgi:integrase